MARVALITGGSRGIGAETARQAARAGYDVALSHRSSESAASAVVAKVEAEGRRAFSAALDVTDETAVVGFFERAFEFFGRLDVVVANAGIVQPLARVDTFSADRIRRVFDVNAVGAFLTAREAVRKLSSRHGGQGGSIVFVSSAASYLGSPGEYVDYAASKGAVDTLTLGLAREVAREGIRVNAVRPGLIKTEIHADSGEAGRVERLASGVPLGRGGTAAEVAEAVLWLASPAASYVTGALLDCSGGR